MFGRSVRTTQPQGPSRIDWSNPITRGLLVANTPTLGRINPVNGSPSIVESGVIGARARPQGVQFNAATANRGWGVSGLSALTLHTLYDASSGFQRSFNAASSSTNQTLFWDFSYPTLYLVLFNGSYPALVNTGITRPTSGVIALTAVSSSVGYRTYVNGIFTGQTPSFPLNFSVIDQVGFMYRQSGTLFNDVLTGGVFGSAWNRALSDAEIKSLSDNPWQIFASDSKSLWTPAAASVSLPTLVQPSSTTSAGAWTATGAASLHEAINELVPSDAQYISVNSASTTELLLDEAAYPGASNQTLAYRASSTQGSTLTVTLKQGATQIMTRTHALTGTDTLYTQTLTSGEIALITAGPISVTLTTS